MGEATTTTASGPRAWLGQALLYGLFAAVIGVFSHWPPYRHLAGDLALIKLSLVHTGKPVGDCHQRPAEELAALPPNMRAPQTCPRERSPVIVELDIDGEPAARGEAARLKVAARAACLELDRTTWRAGRVVTHVRQLFRGDRFDLIAEFRAGA